MSRLTKRGSVGVEVAIILPLIILGILTISYLIKVNCINETVMSVATDEVRKLSVESYTPVGSVTALNFPTKLSNRIEENSNCIYVKTNKFKYLYTRSKIDNLISFNIDYKINCNLPISFYGSVWGKDTVIARAFLGSDNYNKTKGFSVMEEFEEPEMVWVFPIAGKKYHKKNCPYIKVAATQTILTKEIMKKYKPCSICNSKNLSKGSIVYCFFNSGKSYHCASCPTVDRYVVEIEKNEAIRRGYTPCLKCGGI